MIDKKKCIITDLEGVLSDDNHRKHFYNQQDYTNYNDNFHKDNLNNTFFDKFIKTSTCDVMICTAKSELYKESVKDWLIDKNIFHYFTNIFFREKLDSRPSVDVKKDQLKKIEEEYDVICAYDDRKENIDMYIENRVPAILVKITENKPSDLLKSAANLFEQKNTEYGNSYKYFGKIMMSLFPDGLKLETEKDFTRFSVLNITLSKIDRYCKNFTKGGHKDSLDDIMVYCAMLNEVDSEKSID